MKKTEINPLPNYFDRYINLVEDISLIKAIENSKNELVNFDVDQYNKIQLRSYSEGKWSVNELFQHILDTERIFAYRALVFARNDQTPLPSFSENNYATESNANMRELSAIIEELIAVRITTFYLFNSFSEEVLLRTGYCSNGKMSVGCLGFIIVGHQKHHLNVIEEKYATLL